MKTLTLAATTLSLLLPLAIGTTASANETTANATLLRSMSSVSSQTQGMLDDCLSEDSSSRAVRACTKLIRGAAPIDNVKARLYAQRALHQMSLGRFDNAADDFSRAGDLSDHNGLASMGHGFVAMMDDDLTEARRNFEDCSRDTAVAPLAEYGLGLTHQMAGETVEARDAYARALDMRPGWTAVTEQMASLKD